MEISKLNQNGIIYDIEDEKALREIVEVKYKDLKTMRDSSELKSGSSYRITDYVTTTKQVGTTSANHPFDIIVTAISKNTLSEKAKVVLHGNDSYFANSNINSWEIHYCLDNDVTRFSWADTNNGKGVIYYMKDERGNICHYDFKNILISNGYYNQYTFNFRNYDGIDYSVRANNFSKCTNNIIQPYYENGVQAINCIVIVTDVDNDDSCFSNTFETQCCNINVKSLLNRCNFGKNNSYIELNSLENSTFFDNIRGLKVKAISANNVIIESENLSDADKPFVIDDENMELSNIHISTGVFKNNVSITLSSSYSLNTYIERGIDDKIHVYQDLFGKVENLLNKIETDVNINTQHDKNQANMYGYYGTLFNYGLRGSNLDLKNITVYTDSGTTEISVYCKVLVKVDNKWSTAFISNEPVTLQNINGQAKTFTMRKFSELLSVSDKDKVAIVFYTTNSTNDTNKCVVTRLKTKSGIIGAIGGNQGVVSNLSIEPSTQGYSPAISFVYSRLNSSGNELHNDKDEEIYGIKTFKSPINIENKTTISNAIDGGELKVLHNNSSKGFIVRTVNEDKEILPLEILSTNGVYSYKYSFPLKNGSVLLSSTIASRTSGLRLFINENGELDVTQ